MNFSNFFVIVSCFILASCSIEKTDYEAEITTETTEYSDFKEVISSVSGDYTISIDALNGTLYKGYNEIHLKINHSTSGDLVSGDVSVLPIATHTDGSHYSCPHKYNLEYDDVNEYYVGYVVFTDESDTNISWQFYINFQDNSLDYTVEQSIYVEEQTNMNLNMTSFTGNDGEQYFIALISPQSPEVAENNLIAGIYKYNQPTDSGGDFPDPSQYSYSIVNDYTLLLDPRMPEASMGNHSSPNNEDLVQQGDDLYHGVVNYTMTGNWTLNFILKDEDGQTIKGTSVSTDFTPGVEGEKSELYIDILF